jgi:threonine dehydrogenase-like Zn-dependent dehydrogenase
MAETVAKITESAKSMVTGSRDEPHIVCTPVCSKDSKKVMRAVEWHGSQKLKVVDRPAPLITDPTDAIVKITTAAICGSDLHMYNNEVPGSGAMQSRDVLGHEAVGIVEAVGPRVSNFKVGDRVSISAVIACGSCGYCKAQRFSECDYTNPSKEMESLYGHRISGIFGYTHLTGGFDGLQAELARVPLADTTLLKLPDAINDDQAVLLSDILCTAWHGNELGCVGPETKTVAVWGCGPVGLLAVYLAKHRGAKRVIAIDSCNRRLQLAKDKGMADDILNFNDRDTVLALKEMIPEGLDVSIDCAGFRFPKTKLNKFMAALNLASDSSDIIDEMVRATRKGGRIVLIGDYFGKSNLFPIGAFMEKGQTMVGGQVWVHKYRQELLRKLERKEIDPTFVISDHVTLEEVPDAYRRFNNLQTVKVIVKTPFGLVREGATGIQTTTSSSSSMTSSVTGSTTSGSHTRGLSGTII